MIELILRLTRPLFVPLLKLKTEPPHLPEGSALVRSLRPSEAWFTWRALTAMFGLLGQVIGTGVGAIALVAKLGGLGWALAALLVLVEVVIVSFTLVATRVDYELRFFLVGDRSLRVTEGAIVRREVTLSYANVQNLEVTQGPLERLFGFQNLTVTTAGADQVPGMENSHAGGPRRRRVGSHAHPRHAASGEGLGPRRTGAVACWTLTRAAARGARRSRGPARRGSGKPGSARREVDEARQAETEEGEHQHPHQPRRPGLVAHHEGLEGSDAPLGQHQTQRHGCEHGPDHQHPGIRAEGFRPVPVREVHQPPRHAAARARQAGRAVERTEIRPDGTRRQHEGRDEDHERQSPEDRCQQGLRDDSP
jgi:membrane protein YdbS with pleckstrin-like domain